MGDPTFLVDLREFAEIRQPGTGLPMRLRAAAVIVLLCGACVSHPVGPARTFAKYEGKAATTAKSALSAVNTARLVARGAMQKRLFGPYVGTVVSESEDGLQGTLGTFSSIQPPNAKADDLRDELTALLNTAGDHLSALRIAVRRGDINALAPIEAQLKADAAQLEKFGQEH